MQINANNIAKQIIHCIWRNIPANFKMRSEFWQNVLETYWETMNRVPSMQSQHGPRDMALRELSWNMYCGFRKKWVFPRSSFWAFWIQIRAWSLDMPRIQEGLSRKTRKVMAPFQFIIMYFHDPNEARSQVVWSQTSVGVKKIPSNNPSNFKIIEVLCIYVLNTVLEILGPQQNS